jgi:hypothetical protein
VFRRKGDSVEDKTIFFEETQQIFEEENSYILAFWASDYRERPFAFPSGYRPIEIRKDLTSQVTRSLAESSHLNH